MHYKVIFGISLWAISTSNTHRYLSEPTLGVQERQAYKTTPRGSQNPYIGMYMSLMARESVLWGERVLMWTAIQIYKSLLDVVGLSCASGRLYYNRELKGNDSKEYLPLSKQTIIMY